MTDERPDLTPPDPGPMSDDRKHEIRAQVLAAIGASQPPRRGWLGPGLAAAAVAAIVATGVYITHDDGSNRSTSPLQPADTTVSAHTVPSTTIQKGPPPPAPPPAENCADAVNELIMQSAPPLAGATPTASRAGTIGTTYLYESKAAWVVCDDFASVDGGAPTLLPWHLKSDPYSPTGRTIDVSENVVGEPGHLHHQYLAGGRNFTGVRAISYTFPDGHTEQAIIGQDGLWTMNYQPTAGILVDPNVNESELDPIKGSVTYDAATGGAIDTTTLRWILRTCAQTNHGC